MKKLFLSICLLLSGLSFAQDTTWVQTFTFDSIAARRGIFNFPPELNNKRFEKVLMYYKLRCSPLTPWDQYDCGEWDYLTYARVFDHTGEFDSVQVMGKLFVSNFTSPNSLDFTQTPYTETDTYQRQEKNRSAATLSTQNINTADALDKFPFDVSTNGGRAQYLVLASELSAAGVTAGNIQSLSLYLTSFLLNGELKYPVISLKSTALTELTAFQSGGFTEVYNASHWASGSRPDLITGTNELLFYQPFSWDGTSNLVLDFSFQNTSATPGANVMLFEAENISTNTAVGFDALNGTMQFDGSNQALTQLSDFYMGDQMTIAFWAKGTGSTGTNTSILEAYDTLNNRIVNLHFPWSDNNMYFDAGNGGGSYDRINKLMTSAEIDNNWNHWALVKNAAAGTMQIYKNGVLWHSGTGKTQPVGYVHRLVFGTNSSGEYDWKGKIDEFQLYNTALSQSEIQDWMRKKIDNTHPNWNNLLLYYDFDNKAWAEDMSQTDKRLMPSASGMIRFDEAPLFGQQLGKRPVIGFGQGTVNGAMTTGFFPEKRLKEPVVVFEYSPVNRHFEIVNSRVGVPSGAEMTYDASNQIVSQTPFTGTSHMDNMDIWYYQQPFELVHDIEIGRYITPYGIGFDLGPNGFTYLYEVTDYQQYLKNTVDLEAHNTQELIDLRFAFIEGIPPRDVHNRQPIWSEWRSYQYADMDNNNVLQSVNVELADTSEMFKIKTRFTGHGHNGSVNCCEWDSKDHMISINGTPRFNWEIWQESECGDNPNTAQGGTWPYAREGWCPGDMVKEYDHELTPFVNPGETVAFDYDIENVPANDLAQGNGNYIVAMDLISYSAPNFQHDAAIVDVLNPNNYEYYKKFNPTCSYPRVILQNTGEQALTQCIIRIYIESDQVIDYPWTGNLAFLQKEIVEIPVDDLTWWQAPNGTHTFHAELISVEGSATADEYAANNIKTTRFQSPEIAVGPFFVWFITNNRAAENKYTLIKDNGDVVFQRQNMSNQTHYRDTFNLDPGCYSIILEDSDHDGISFWYSSQVEGETAGNFMVRRVGGSTLETFPGDFGHYHRYNFSVGLENVSTEELPENSGLFVYPNPNNGEFYIDLGGKTNGKAELEISDLSGRTILCQNMQAGPDNATTTVDLKNATAGMYLIKVTTGTRIYTEQLIKK